MYLNTGWPGWYCPFQFIILVWSGGKTIQRQTRSSVTQSEALNFIVSWIRINISVAVIISNITIHTGVTWSVIFRQLPILVPSSPIVSYWFSYPTPELWAPCQLETKYMKIPETNCSCQRRRKRNNVSDLHFPYSGWTFNLNSFWLSLNMQSCMLQSIFTTCVPKWPQLLS